MMSADLFRFCMFNEIECKALWEVKPCPVNPGHFQDISQQDQDLDPNLQIYHFLL